MDKENINDAPRGFEFVESEMGAASISYRTRGSIGIGIFFTLWLSLWTPGCIFLTIGAFTKSSPENIILFVMMLGFWAGWFFAVRYVLLHFFSVTSFEVDQGILRVSRKLFSFKKIREFRLEDIDAIQQIKDGGGGEDSFPTWGLAIEGKNNVSILSRQKIEKSDWLGPILAEWVGVDYRPAVSKKDYKQF